MISDSYEDSDDLDTHCYNNNADYHDCMFGFILKVAIHGYFSFGRAETCCPSLSVPSSRNSDYTVAPFETSTVISENGSVSYEVHSIDGHSSLLGRVNKFIRQTEQNTFAGTWMLLAEWRNVSQSGNDLVHILYL